MESDAQSSYPGKILDLAIEESIIDKKQKDQLWFDNVLKWLGADHDPSFKNRMGIK